jgi:adenylate kinase
MRVALTGTPGTGKTSAASLLQNKGYQIIDLNKVAIDKGFIVGIDKQRKSKLIDVELIDSYIAKKINGTTHIFVEGHASHLLNTMQRVIILRCHPHVLHTRLIKKRWGEQKMQENELAETLDIILCESVEKYPKEHLFEIDTTKKTIEEVVAAILEILHHGFSPIKKYNIGKIDWSEDVL